jgi:uncharacterized glyoxalase superfamily protein PhnB
MAAKPNPVRPIPEGYSTITPWLIVRGAVQFLDYLKEVFGAEELARVYNEDGAIGDSVVMMFDAKEAWPDTPSFIRLYVEDGDAVYQRALAAGVPRSPR